MFSLSGHERKYDTVRSVQYCTTLYRRAGTNQDVGASLQEADRATEETKKRDKGSALIVC